ncbi:MAG: beta-lactamase family protein [bacterium]|nr:beta-lactamase family protein [bacterium]
MSQNKNSKTVRVVIYVSLLVSIVALGVGLVFGREIYRLYKVVSLFDAGVITENFRRMPEFFPSHTVSRGDGVFEFQSAPQELPATYEYRGETRDVREFLKRTDTSGLLILKDDRIVFEEYWKGHTVDTRHISWSVGKSFVSAMFGVAIDEGFVESIEDPVTKYAPELSGTGYDGVRIKDVLQMSSGVGFDEDYGAFFSDINRMGRVIALGTPINEFVASLENAREPGSYQHYVSMDTQVLGMILRNATNRPLAQYLSETIWSKIGMQADAAWLIDDSDMELAFGTLNATLRDYARFGRLYLNEGAYGGEQIVPADWVRASVTPDAPHLQPGQTTSSSTTMGYGYQWWIPENRDGSDFSAIGIYGQFIYVNPERSVVIVKNSSFADFTKVRGSSGETLAMFQSIARALR